MLEDLAIVGLRSHPAVAGAQRKRLLIDEAHACPRCHCPHHSLLSPRQRPVGCGEGAGCSQASGEDQSLKERLRNGAVCARSECILISRGEAGPPRSAHSPVLSSGHKQTVILD